jgi:hypothetical protein
MAGPASPVSFRKWRRLRVIGSFLLGLVVLDFVVWSNRTLWDTYAPDDYAARLEGCRRRPRDLVVVGGSAVTEGIDPSLLAGVVWQGQRLADVYSLGLPGATTTECWHALRHGLAAPPRLLVCGITASDLNDRRNEPHGPYELMELSDLVSWWRTKPTSGEWATRQFVQGRLTHIWQLYRQREGIRLWAGLRVEQIWPGSFPDTAREAQSKLDHGMNLHGQTGFAPNAVLRTLRFDQMKERNGPPDRFGFLDGFRLGDHLKYLERMLDWAADKGVSVVLVDMPVTADLDERLYPAVFTQFRAALADIERSRGVRVLRPSRAELGLTDAQFADLIHLNGDGCTRLSGWLRQQLADQQEQNPAATRVEAAR